MQAVAVTNWSETLRVFRTRNNLKQDAIAAELSVSQAYVSRIESGVATPSPPVQERILKLLDEPAMRPVFDQLVAAVRCSSAMTALLRCVDGRIVVEAASDTYRAFGPPFSEQKIGSPLQVELGDEGRSRLRDLVRHGAFTGEVACVDVLWTVRNNGRDRCLRTTSTPIRPEPGVWLVLTTTVEMGPGEYSAFRTSWGGEVRVHGY